MFYVPQLFNKTFHPKAKAFFDCINTASEDLSKYQKNAVHQLVIDLFNTNLWTKFPVAIWPIVGGTSNTHRVNLITPSQNLTSMFPLGYGGSPTHDINGIDFNGSSQYARTFWGNGARNGVTSPLNCHFSYYNNDSVAAPSYQPIGFYGANNPAYSNVLIGFGFQGGDVYQADQAYTGVAYTQYTPPRNQGFRIITRASASDFRSYFQGLRNTTDTRTVGVTAFDGELYLGARSSPSGVEYSTQRVSFASVGYSLNDTEALTFSNIVIKFKQAIGAAV